ncbi:MAG TPA: zinc ribbon domain-containing protein [Thermotogota bacterium]|jgi:putative FmdB family regulatory protein|nr:zinc ribbon domain-containing protein [Thermotogota bacterium]NLZ14892.1 zinc ribbon domain-containing protein [Thermotogaceae bacterium]MDD8041303.1 zinc ribbon domain-containing protein [Thermotogota bacterium]HNR63487.1 zinc ribbon domain-containing protein [Thermotogota bacterium]HNT94982.1 zinc ribbon domain-containing protein [Thermotogota bacterium]
MPIYRYKCDQCEKETEVFQGIHDNPLTTCEDCGGRLRKVIGRVGIKFSGSGYYVTDAKKSNFSSSVDTKSDTKDTKKTAEVKQTPVVAQADPVKKEAV